MSFDENARKLRAKSFRRLQGVTTVCTLKVGVGPNCAIVIESLLCSGAAPPSAIIVVGFAGGLDPKLMPGSIVAADCVLDVRTGELYAPDPTLLEAVSRVGHGDISLDVGRVATDDHVLVLSSEKQRLAQSTQAVAVDMESSVIARAASRYGVPWIAVRVITDGLNDDLPLDFNVLARADGSVHRGAILMAALLRPWTIPGLIRLGGRSSQAARNLATFLHSYTSALLER